jgi:hypothetical protein
MLHPLLRSSLSLALTTAFMSLAHSQTAPAKPDSETEAEAVLHPWQTATPRLAGEAYFTNLKDGDKIETPFVVKFGLSGGWGLAPVSKPSQGKAGHHHMLVNRELPLNFKSALPFNDQYIHFGKGQMETVLTFPPGQYTLRMLLANQQHLPYFVYSKPATITVTKKNGTDPKTLQAKGISMMITEGAEVRPPFRIQFHASSLNVAHLSQKEKDTGHFRLTMTPKTGAPAVMNFVNGQTETWLAPPPGSYRVQLELLDNVQPDRLLTAPATTDVKVL